MAPSSKDLIGCPLKEQKRHWQSKKSKIDGASGILTKKRVAGVSDDDDQIKKLLREVATYNAKINELDEKIILEERADARKAEIIKEGKKTTSKLENKLEDMHSAIHKHTPKRSERSIRLPCTRVKVVRVIIQLDTELDLFETCDSDGKPGFATDGEFAYISCVGEETL